jgi:2-oxoglutarate ferredoxin oxidoreductase subunit gamma
MIKVLIAGEGGQGVQVIAEILARAAFAEGKKALYIPNFGVEQRGGVSLAFVIVDSKLVVYPKFEKADLLAILTERAAQRVESYIDQKTKIIQGPAITKKDFGLPAKTWNVLVLGQINKEGQIVSKEDLEKSLKARFAKQFTQNPELERIDLEALGKGK